MTSLPEQLQGLLTDSGISTEIGDQIGLITGAASTIGELIKDPPEEVAGLSGGLGEIAIPGIQLPQELVNGFSGISSAIPTDPGSITGSLDHVLSGVSSAANLEVLGTISEFLQCLEHATVLLETDFSRFRLDNETSSAGKAAPAADPEPESGDFPGGALGSDPSAPEGDSTPAHAPEAGGDTDTPAKDPTEENTGVAAAKNISQVLAVLPDPFNAQNAVVFFRDLLKGLPRNNAQMRHIPVYDDLVGLLDTASLFSRMDAAGCQAHIETTLHNLADTLDREGPKAVQNLSLLLSRVQEKIDLAGLSTQTTAITLALDEFARAVAAHDLGTIDAALASADTALDLILPRMEDIRDNVLDQELLELNRSLADVYHDLNCAMQGLNRMLAPPAMDSAISLIENLVETGMVQAESGIEELTRAASELFGHLTELISLLNAQKVTQALDTLAGGLETALASFDTAMAQVTGSVSSVCDQVDNALDAVDIQGVRQDVEAALEQINTSITSVVENLFAPAATAVSSAVGAIKTAVDSFDPEQIKTSLEDLIDQITAIFSAPQVLDTVNLIKTTIETVTDQIQAVSFTPVVDPVVDGIQGVETVLEKVPAALVSDSLKQALADALDSLPDDLAPAIDALTAELDDLMEAGPESLILQIREPVAAMADQLNEISPAALLKSTLSHEYQDLMDNLAGFTPSRVLTPVADALDDVKQRVREQMDLDPLFTPLETAYTEMSDCLDQLNPAVIIDPVNQQIQTLTSGMLDALPEERVFHGLDSLVSGLEIAREGMAEIRSMVDKLAQMKDALSDPQVQLTQWLEPVLDQVDTIPQIPGLDTVLDRISSSVDQLDAAGLTTRITDTLTPVRTLLTDLDPGTAHADLTAAYARLNQTAIQALPETSQKTALLALLDRFNPTAPLWTRVFGQLDDTRIRLQHTLDNTGSRLSDWDDRFFTAQGPFAELRGISSSGTAVNTLMRQGIEDHIIAPAGRLLAAAAGAFTAFDGPVAQLQTFVDEVDSLFADILDGPGSIGQIKDTLTDMVSRIESLNLDFLEAELSEIFDTVKEKMDALSPAGIRTDLQSILDETMDLIDIGQVLPGGQVQKLDTTYGATLQKLSELNPDALILAVVQPVFDEKIEPILKLFDLTGPIDALLERLGSLARELNTELTRVNAAYKEMLTAVPL